MTTIQQNLQAAIRRKEAKEREDRERAEKRTKREVADLIRQELPKGRVVVSEPPRPVARHATELPFPAAMIRAHLGTVNMVHITIDGRTWRATTRYDDMVAKVTAAPEAGRIGMFKGMTTPTALKEPMVVPKGIFNQTAKP